MDQVNKVRLLKKKQIVHKYGQVEVLPMVSTIGNKK
jgi:hypothetical protein